MASSKQLKQIGEAIQLSRESTKKLENALSYLESCLGCGTIDKLLESFSSMPVQNLLKKNNEIKDYLADLVQKINQVLNECSKVIEAEAFAKKVREQIIAKIPTEIDCNGVKLKIKTNKYNEPYQDWFNGEDIMCTVFVENDDCNE